MRRRPSRPRRRSERLKTLWRAGSVSDRSWSPKTPSGRSRSRLATEVNSNGRKPLMRKHLVLGLAALTGLVGWGATARADVLVRVPFVTVRVGTPGPVVVNPPVTGPIVVNPPARPAVIIGQPIDVPPVESSPRVVIQEPPARVVVSRAPTLDEFAKSFQPVAGKHEVVIQHPVTCEPV